MPILRALGPRYRPLLITGVGWAAYIASFHSLDQLFAPHTGIFAFVPLVLTAWHWGSIAGVLAGGTALGITVALLSLTAGTSTTAWMSMPGLLGTATFVLTGYVIGRLRDLHTLRDKELRERQLTEQALRQRDERLTLVNAITRRIRNDDSVDSIIHAVVEGLGAHFPDFDTSYATADLGGFDAVCTQRQIGTLDATRRRFDAPLTPEYLDWLSARRLLAIEDISATPPHGGLEEALVAANVRAYLTAPIVHGNAIIGLLAIHGATAHHWTDHEQATVHDAAEVLAVALEDASRKQQLRESEEKFRLLAEHSPVDISLIQKKGLVYSNRSMQRMTGYSAAELTQLDFLTLVAPDHREQAREVAARRFAGEPLDTPHELKLLTKNGQERWVEFLGCTVELGGEPTLFTSAIDTTQRKQAEELLIESETRLRSVLDQLGDGVAVVANGALVYVNPTLCQLIGYEPNEILETDPVKLVTPDGQDRARRLIRDETSDASALHEALEFEVTHRDGSPIPVEVIPRRVTYSGSPALLATVRDLTRRKRDERRLREQDERMQILLDQHPDGVLLIVDGQVAYANSAACKMSGRAADELIGQDPLAITLGPKEYERAVARRLSGATLESEPKSVEYDSIRHDGTVLPVEVVASPPIQYCGATAEFVTIRDLTGRRRAEQAIRDSEARFRTLFEQAPIGIVVAKPDTTFMQVNETFCEMLGYTENELIGKSIADVTHPDDRGGSPTSAKRILEDAESIVRFQKRYLCQDGTAVQAETTVSLVRDNEGQLSYALAMIEDVTQRRRLEQQVEQVQRLESVGQLAGGVAHNFNNALTAIYGYSELLGRRFEPGDPALNDLEQIKRVAEQSASLTRQLLAFSRKEQVRPSVFPFNTLVHQTRDMLAPILGDQIEIVSHLGNTPTLVQSDRAQMEQVVTNLLLNARDAMPSGGTLTIEIGATTVDDVLAARHPDARPGRYVTLTVTDTGLGMDDETRSRIFEPFFTTKEQGKGVGLGLAMVHGAVTQSGGFIAVDSTIGMGSSFSVYLPQARNVESDPDPEKVDTSTTR